MKKIVLMGLALLAILLGALALGGRSVDAPPPADTTGVEEARKLRVVASLFPQYDFAKRIAGDRAEVTLLLPPGTEGHTYDPSPSDVARIEAADVFLYTGEYMEPWAERIVSGARGDALLVADVSEGIALRVEGARGEAKDMPHVVVVASGDTSLHAHDGRVGDDPSHDHGAHEHDDHAREAHDHELAHASDDALRERAAVAGARDHDPAACDDPTHDHDHGGYDPHFWLNPLLAVEMMRNVEHALASRDPANAAHYRANADALEEDLRALDADFARAAAQSDRKVLVFGGKFAYRYFLDRYALDYVSAYASCSAEAEPSVRDVARVIGYVKDNRIPCIYHEAFDDPKVARTIAEATGAEALLFHTAHNLSRAELDEGMGFVDVMRRNLANVEKGLR